MTALAQALVHADVTHVFGLPGTQNALPVQRLSRRTSVRTVLTGSESMAAFMANGFARAGGGVPVVAAIPGPGFTYALTGFAEAAHDNAALVLLTGVPAERPGKAFDLQALDQAGMVRGPRARACCASSAAADARQVMGGAVAAATCRGGGPVLVEVARDVLEAAGRTGGRAGPLVEPPPAPDPRPFSPRSRSDCARRARWW